MLEIQILAWDSHKNVVGFNQLMWSNMYCVYFYSTVYMMVYNKHHVPKSVGGQWSPIS